RHDYGTARGGVGPGHWELLWVHFLPRPHWVEWMHWPEVAPGIGHLALGAETATRRRVEDAMETMLRYATGGLARRDDFAMNALEAALLWCDGANPLTAARDARLDPRVRRAMTLLRERLAEPLTVPEVAAAAGLSASRFAHLFREQTGQTPQQYVEGERIARAQELLTFTARSVASIAEDVGFASPFYFTLRFKKRTGLSPRDWRQEAAKRADGGGAG
ncbi:MAG TPA: AraC family transcriptional regulator, partial [Armatimonadaceae bacterium]|nr:AraC family transcriptional regulator [Armatimonadaceae bacterium]